MCWMVTVDGHFEPKVEEDLGQNLGSHEIVRGPPPQHILLASQADFTTAHSKNLLRSENIWHLSGNYKIVLFNCLGSGQTRQLTAQ